MYCGIQVGNDTVRLVNAFLRLVNVDATVTRSIDGALIIKTKAGLRYLDALTQLLDPYHWYRLECFSDDLRLITHYDGDIDLTSRLGWLTSHLRGDDCVPRHRLSCCDFDELVKDKDVAVVWRKATRPSAIFIGHAGFKFSGYSEQGECVYCSVRPGLRKKIIIKHIPSLNTLQTLPRYDDVMIL